jgi:hypothetical protein
MDHRTDWNQKPLFYKAPKRCSVPPGFSISPIAAVDASGRAGALGLSPRRFRGRSSGRGVTRFAPEVADRRRELAEKPRAAAGIVLRQR